MKQWLSILILILLVSCKQDAQQDAPATTIHDRPELAALTAQIEQQPTNAELYFNRAETYAGLGYFAEAIADYQQAIELDESRDYYYVALSDLYLLEYAPRLNLPDSKRAIDLLELYLDQYPDNLLVLQTIADSYLYTEQYDTAIARLKTAIELKPYNPDAWLAIGLNLKYKGDTLQAIAGFRKAVEQDPELYDAHMQLAVLFSAIGNEQAITYFDNALAINPESQEARYGKGLYLQRKGRYEEAKALYRDMVTADPQAKEALYNLGVVYISQDSLPKAWQFFDMATKVAPDYVDAYYGRGTVSELQGEKEAAISDFRNCLQLDPDFAKAEEALQALFESENPS